MDSSNVTVKIDFNKDILHYIQNCLITHLTPKSDPCCGRGIEWPCDVAETLLNFEQVGYLEQIFSQANIERCEYSRTCGVWTKSLFIGDITQARLKKVF